MYPEIFIKNVGYDRKHIENGNVNVIYWKVNVNILYYFG